MEKHKIKKRFITSATRQVRVWWCSVGIFPLGPCWRGFANRVLPHKGKEVLL